MSVRLTLRSCRYWRNAIQPQLNERFKTAPMSALEGAAMQAAVIAALTFQLSCRLGLSATSALVRKMRQHRRQLLFDRRRQQPREDESPRWLTLRDWWLPGYDGDSRSRSAIARSTK
jgi:hypothetical protein